MGPSHHQNQASSAAIPEQSGVEADSEPIGKCVRQDGSERRESCRAGCERARALTQSAQCRPAGGVCDRSATTEQPSTLPSSPPAQMGS